MIEIQRCLWGVSRIGVGMFGLMGGWRGRGFGVGLR